MNISWGFLQNSSLQLPMIPRIDKHYFRLSPAPMYVHTSMITYRSLVLGNF